MSGGDAIAGALFRRGVRFLFTLIGGHISPIITGAKALVGNDASWAQIARDQVSYLHDDAATVLRRSDYHVVAEGLGARGLIIRKESEIKPVLRKAWKLLRSGKPVLVNALIGKSDFRRGSISM